MTAYTKSSTDVKLAQKGLTQEAMQDTYYINLSTLKGGDTLTIKKYDGVTAYAATIDSQTPNADASNNTASISGNTVTIGGDTTISSKGISVITVSYGPE